MDVEWEVAAVVKIFMAHEGNHEEPVLEVDGQHDEAAMKK